MNGTQKLYPVFTFVILLIIILLGRGFLKTYLIEEGVVSYQAHSLLSTGFNIILMFVALYFIKKHHLEALAGISKTKLRKWTLLIFPLYLVLLNALNLDEFATENLWLNIGLLIIYCLSIGLSEELSIRGFLQSYLIKHFGNTKRNLILSAILAALIFGLLHLFKFDKGLYGELSQVFFATFIGLMFGAILLHTKRLYPLIIIHAIIDFAAKFDDMNIPAGIETTSEGPDLVSAAIVTAIVLPCFIYGLLLLKRLKMSEVAR